LTTRKEHVSALRELTQTEKSDTNSEIEDLKLSLLQTHNTKIASLKNAHSAELQELKSKLDDSHKSQEHDAEEYEKDIQKLEQRILDFDLQRQEYDLTQQRLNDQGKQYMELQVRLPFEHST
jgi:hypothetical protein